MSINTIPDLQARQSALDITQSFLVQAPAGSGKTELLTQRFLKLLSFVETPEEIIAITFTNKAAAEMRSRIIAALEKAESLPEPSSAHEKATWLLAKAVLKQSQLKNWHLREHPNRLRILTLDALSLQIAQKLPISSKLGAQLDIAEDPESLYQHAAKMILLSPPKDAPWLEDIKTLLLYLDNDYYRLETLLTTLLSKRDQWLPLIMLGNNTVEKRALLEKELMHVNEFILQAGENLLSTSLKDEIEALAIYASATLPRPNVGASGGSPSKKEHWLLVAEMLLTKADELRKKSDKNNGFPPASSSKSAPEKAMFEEYKQRFESLVNALSVYPDYIQWLAEVRKLPELHYSDTQWQVLSTLFTLLPLCAAQLRLTFSHYNQVDYIENAQSALHALGSDENPTDISLSLDHKIQHLLIDEFQDTSSNQFLLIKKLTAGWMPDDGRTLFLVGDPMQSIYRFRQAEVGLFLHAKHYGIGDIHLDFITLTSNFRSSTTIVHWLNKHFQSIFPQKEDIRFGAIPYSQAHAIHKNKDNDSQIQCAYFSQENDLAEEQFIIQQIKNIQQNFPQESIAILIRSRDHLKTITPLLQSNRIEYQAVDIETLSHKAIIYDLLSLTRACVHLGDNIAWLACLRAPWCGLSLHDLWNLTHTKNTATLWEAISEDAVINTLSDDGRQRLHHFRQAITPAIQQRQRMSLRDTIESTWRQLGGEALLSPENQLSDIERFFSLLEKITDPTGIININLLEQKVTTLFAAAPHAKNNPVHIMTIHKAKGLEFDHIFLPKLHKKTAALDRPLIAWLEYPDQDNIHHLLMAPMSEVNTSDKTYDYIQKQQQKKLLLEMDRVLYVAITRAKKCLILTAALEIDSAPSNSSLLGRLWATHPHLFQLQCFDGLLESLDPFESTEKSSPGLHRISSSMLQEFSLIPKNKNEYKAHQENSPDLILPSHRDEAKLGTLIHLLIEQLTQLGIVGWKSFSLNHQKKIIHSLCQQLNISPENYSSSAEKSLRALDNLIHDPRGQWIIQHRKNARSEYTIYDHDYPQWTKKIIDRCFRDDNGKHWIIDFKTSENNDPHLSDEMFIQQAAKEHYPQLASYKQALHRMTQEQDIQLALYFPLIPAWHIY